MYRLLIGIREAALYTELQLIEQTEILIRYTVNI